MKCSPFTKGYKLPFIKRAIETPEKHCNKAIAVACASTVEVAGGLGFIAAGIAQKDPIFAGIGISILGKIAGTFAMLKGSLWDFAGNFQKKHVNDLVNNVKKANPRISKAELAKLEKNLTV